MAAVIWRRRTALTAACERKAVELVVAFMEAGARDTKNDIDKLHTALIASNDHGRRNVLNRCELTSTFRRKHLSAAHAANTAKGQAAAADRAREMRATGRREQAPAAPANAHDSDDRAAEPARAGQHARGRRQVANSGLYMLGSLLDSQARRSGDPAANMLAWADGDMAGAQPPGMPLSNTDSVESAAPLENAEDAHEQPAAASSRVSGQRGQKSVATSGKNMLGHLLAGGAGRGQGRGTTSGRHSSQVPGPSRSATQGRAPGLASPHSHLHASPSTERMAHGDPGCLAEAEVSSVDAACAADAGGQHTSARQQRSPLHKRGTSVRRSVDYGEAVLSHGAPGMPNERELSAWKPSAAPPCSGAGADGIHQDATCSHLPHAFDSDHQQGRICIESDSDHPPGIPRRRGHRPRDVNNKEPAPLVRTGFVDPTAAEAAAVASLAGAVRLY